MRTVARGSTSGHAPTLWEVGAEEFGHHTDLRGREQLQSSLGDKGLGFSVTGTEWLEQRP